MNETNSDVKQDSDKPVQAGEQQDEQPQEPAAGQPGAQEPENDQPDESNAAERGPARSVGDVLDERAAAAAAELNELVDEQAPVTVNPDLPGLVALREANDRIAAAGDEPPVVAEAAGIDVETRRAPSPEDYDDPEKWPRKRLVDELVRARAELEHVETLIDRLSRWVMDKVPEEINPERGEADVASIVIRVLDRWVNEPNGRLEEPVREALDRLDHLPGVDADLIRAEVEIARNHLAMALTADPRPGGGPPPVYESDDIVMVRFDRDRFRVELDLAYKAIAEMYAAAVGHPNGPEIGLVEDIAAVRARALAAEEALLNALRRPVDGDQPVPAKGTPAYAAWAKLVSDVVRGLADSKMATAFGDPGMPVSGRAAPDVVPVHA